MRSNQYRTIAVWRNTTHLPCWIRRLTLTPKSLVCRARPARIRDPPSTGRTYGTVHVMNMWHERRDTGLCTISAACKVLRQSKNNVLHHPHENRISSTTTSCNHTPPRSLSHKLRTQVSWSVPSTHGEEQPDHLSRSIFSHFSTCMRTARNHQDSI